MSKGVLGDSPCQYGHWFDVTPEWDAGAEADHAAR